MSDDTDPRLGIDLTIPRVCCALHGEAFRHEWPKGWMPFTMSLLNIVMAQQAFVDECEGSPGWVNDALDRSPLCERVEPETLLEALTDCGVGKQGVCENCGVDQPGVRMQLAPPGGGVPAWIDHVCFDCIVYRLRSA